MRAGENPGADHGGGGALFASFLPWIVYWILVENVDFRLAVLIAFAISAFPSRGGTAGRRNAEGARPRIDAVVRPRSSLFFTKWYPDEVRRQVRAETASA
jgi:hypothetical protein